ncbi:MAG TPA: glycosyltransferase family 39 protein [Rhizomicrobium sp.]|nr:glycosyltransferase family 39 protein [Rhizomicrobium sp.]
MSEEAAPTIAQQSLVPEVPATAAGRVLSGAAKHWVATLALLCLVLWLPGIFSLPPIDRDESRFAQSSRQMLESHDFVNIKFGHVPRYKKPAGVYWLQSATTAIAGFGDHSHIWTYRLASLLGGIVAVLLCFWCARAFALPEVSWLAAAMLGTSLLLTAESTMATTDAVQLACLMGAMGVLLRVYLAARGGLAVNSRLVLIGWAAFAAGILVKGPVVPGVCAVTIIALIAWDRGEWRWLKSLRPLLGIALVLVIVLPWGIAILFESHGAFYEQSLGQDFAAKLASGQESHGAWPGYYLLLATLTFWPAILFVLPGLGEAIRRVQDPATRFLIAWAGASWLMIEAVPTKLPNYILPAYPPIAILAALWVIWPREANAPRWQRALEYVAAVQFILVALALTAAPILARRYGLDLGGANAFTGVAAAGLLAAVLAAALCLRRARVTAFLFATLAALVFYPTITALAAPHMETLWVSPRAAALAREYARPGDPPVAAAGYIEPSLMFALGSETRLTNGAGAAETGAYQGGLALVEDSERAAFLARLAELDTDAAPLDQLSGFNYTRGRKVHITLYRVSATHDVTVPPAE